MTVVEYWFEVTTLPVGSAPEWVRGEWLGLPLPVRHARPVEGPEPHMGIDVIDRSKRNHISDGVAVVWRDAIDALVFFGRDDAASWWRDHLATRPLVTH